ncbi:MAG: hypothetical protein ACM31C_12085, partial [Acidobacteriota bacterium]
MTRLTACVLVVGGCVAEAPAPAPPPQVAPPAPVDPFGVVVEPRLGQIVTGEPAAATLSVVGVAAAPGAAIDVQVPANVDNLEEWTTIATATSDTTPSITDATMYEWRVAIAPAALDSTRWPRGGLLHLRAVAADGSLLGGFFHDSDACLASVTGWRARAAACGAPASAGVVLVNTSMTPLDLINRPRFLEGRGAIDTGETAAYYQASAAPATLAAFRSAYGFTGSDVAMVYYNAGDLGIGRGMHCAAQPGGGLACYVSNYGAFGGDADDAISRATAGEAAGGTGSFASVAMVYTPPAGAPNSVTFAVYGATGALATSATLDTFGDNTSIPNNCLNCHGAGASYDPVTHAVTGAHFLPFDAANLKFPAQPGLTFADQSGALVQLNALVATADATGAIARIAGDPAAMPDGWNASTLDREVYRNVIAPACRGCH